MKNPISDEFNFLGKSCVQSGKMSEPKPIPRQHTQLFFQQGSAAPEDTNLSSSFPGATKTIQLSQLQNRHFHHVYQGDCSKEYINCNCSSSNPRSEDHQHRTSARETSTHEADKDKDTGIVKWYNGKKKYGFITDLNSQDDYFVHKEDLKPTRSTTPVLYTGEYVQYTKSTAIDGRLKAEDVCGLNRGPLMCDHRTQSPHINMVEDSYSTNV